MYKSKKKGEEMKRNKNNERKNKKKLKIMKGK
jgi:hypothetical protein